MILTTHDLEKRYGNHYALREVAVSVDHGSIYGLVGFNGSGKTTLLIGLDVERSKIALLSDTPHFEPWFTAEEVVDLARHLVSPDIPRARVRGVLDNAALSQHRLVPRLHGLLITWRQQVAQRGVGQFLHPIAQHLCQRLVAECHSSILAQHQDPVLHRLHQRLVPLVRSPFPLWQLRHPTPHHRPACQSHHRSQ